MGSFTFEWDQDYCGASSQWPKQTSGYTSNTD